MLKKKPLKNVLIDCLASSKAVLAVNVQSIQQIEILSSLSLELKRELIIQFSAKYIPYFEKIIGIETILNKYKTNNYLYFHLDHCNDESLIIYCIKCGFDSVMFDGSKSSIKENIYNTKRIVSKAKIHEILVEGEVGIVGGVEDGFGEEGSTIFNMDEALYFYKESGVDLIALGIGNAHGVYSSNKCVDIELLSTFQKNLEVKSQLVLHGATGLDDEQISKAIEFGVVKINLSTELKLLYQKVIMELGGRKIHDEIYFYTELKEKLRPVIENKIKKIM